ncbi:MAG: deoxyguanosinetriphosphate triphosphohydrolase [Zetaproteobacteria bacterium CG_4_9_14_3_um_filter_49_83]|nr:MAG: deoxyguanosinetriphosphate triphosphohydrolase [Zetaproteobacteria bacterium CG1_02_49_23]PIQ33961.1 MAG: deoxyguanosinetriphosphate triphosphohydrolase [Zetaproteobacteria bacterium CG17_big_fil_post_rev_8_21_14_2_50_50_13]PIV30386.1 MAG: deoxyguanosinetriphosphate triphosphohydrolase [Zetaproteobacteria bacterium CG02_land_8_20_14_3_00_50_9]PIY56742.1 MAG: deoxyguanosinetriphosphate triphosphohydrolase [Zetaproteobacteria bacterium CG_4_10_14_0_8_um_filter_49_80]PJA35962.1 MAG: deoxyg
MIIKQSHYEDNLASYACKSILSYGKEHDETESKSRNIYQRDRDRIVHSTAFRRLEYKTQVFVNHEGDYYRTRLTHSIEVAQIARSICRAMCLHEDLAEAVALAHDLGHTPFGHSGQDALNDVMKPYGGFEHNRQSLRIVEKLEDKYFQFAGLNLSYETREGIVKHKSPHDLPKNDDLNQYRLAEQATLEAQIANLADEIAYNNHDIDDGFRAGMLKLSDLKRTQLFGMHFDEVNSLYMDLDERHAVSETIRRMIDHMINDVIEASCKRIENRNILTLADVRNSPKPLIAFSRPLRHMNGELKKYLYRNMYHHYRVVRMASKAERVIKDIFLAYFERPEMLPDGPRERVEAQSKGMPDKKARVIADYIASMTDRFALDEYERLFSVHAKT